MSTEQTHLMALESMKLLFSNVGMSADTRQAGTYQEEEEMEEEEGSQVWDEIQARRRDRGIALASFIFLRGLLMWKSLLGLPLS